MKLSTKYNIGDHAYYLDNGKAVDGVIEKISVKIDNGGVRVKYLMVDERHDFFRMMRDDYDFIDGDKLFNSKEELIASL